MRIKKFKLEVTPEELLVLANVVREVAKVSPSQWGRLSSHMAEEIDAGMELDLDFLELAESKGWTREQADEERKKYGAGEDGAKVGSNGPRE